MKLLLTAMTMILALSLSVKANVNKNTVASTIRFETNDPNLDTSDRERLSALIAKERAKGKIDHVEIAVWSDQAFPANRTDLSKPDRDLAEKRAESLKDYLKDNLNVSKVTTYNMAETSNWLARAFNTEQAELRAVFSKEGSAPLAREDFEVIRSEGGPSKAVVVVIHNKKELKKGG